MQEKSGGRILRFFGVRDLLPQMQKLYQRGGSYKRAADQLMTLSQKVKDDDEFDADAIFQGFRVTKHGETRVAHCVKYDLSQYARLITVQHKGLCVICFAGTHDESEGWLNSHVGYVPLVKKDVNSGRVVAAYNSPDVKSPAGRATAQTDLASGLLYQRLPVRYFEKIIQGLDKVYVEKIKTWETITNEDEICEIACAAADDPLASALHDTFIALRAGDLIAAKNRVDQFSGELVSIDQLDVSEVRNLAPGEDFVNLADLDPELLSHYVKTADYRAWMLFLHPDQRAVVDRDFNGPARLAGVSGSGKTAVIIKRALRLAEKYSSEKILVLTLNRSLSQLIKELVAASAPENLRANVVVSSFWEFCRDKLVEFEPQNIHLYEETTYKANQYVNPEHVDEIWDEYYYQENNNHDAELLFPVHKLLLARGVFPQSYIRQELDYVRSAMGSWQRKRYLTMDRVGRAIGLEKLSREHVLNGLLGWEKKMAAVGVVDYLGLATALYRYRDQLTREFRCVLVDEAQDFGTLELDIIRRLVQPQENDLFFSGDVAQQVYTKHHDYAAAGINIIGRSMAIKRNYRNGREILAAAFDVLSKNLDPKVRKDSNLEILDPEFANFSTPKPLLLRARSVREEFAAALNYFRDYLAHASGKDLKLCIAVCGYSLRDLEIIGSSLAIPVLVGSTSLSNGSIFLSDLEQTKGFEFDNICIVNCNQVVLPTIGTPEDEQYRDLSRFYVAMTRAKSELILSYSSEISSFLRNSREFLVEGEWSEYSPSLEAAGVEFPEVSSNSSRDNSALERTGRDFLYSKMALGLPQDLQDKLIDRVQGTLRLESSGRGRKKTIGWTTVQELLDHPMTDDLKQLFGPESWQRIVGHFEGQIKNKNDVTS